MTKSIAIVLAIIAFITIISTYVLTEIVLYIDKKEKSKRLKKYNKNWSNSQK